MKTSKFISFRNLCCIVLCAVLCTACPPDTCKKAKLQIKKTVLEFSHSDGSDSFDIESNMIWNFTSDQTWCTPSSDVRKGDATINVTVQRNTSATPRVAKITVEVDDCDLTKEIVVTQEGEPAQAPYLNVESAQLDFQNLTGNKTLKITANVAWEISSNSDWCTVSPKSGNGDDQVAVNVAANTGLTNRVAKLTIANNQHSLIREIDVTQAAPNQDYILNATPTQLEFLNIAGNKTLQITANVAWEISSNSDWCTVSPKSGNGDDQVAVNVAANTGLTNRVAKLTIVNSQHSLIREIDVTQAAPNQDYILNATPAQLEFLNIAGNKTLQITANVAWEISSNSDWCTVSQNSGSGDASVAVNVTANPEIANRIARLTIANSQHSLIQNITVTQIGEAPYIDISPSSKDIGAEAGTINVTVSANVEFDVTPNVSWISVTQATATAVTLQAQANTTNASRTGTVTFKQKGGNETATLTIKQDGTPELYINITPTSKDIGYKAETFNVTVSANVEFDVTPNVSWITVTQATATAVTLQAQENTATASRTGTVTFKQKGGNETATLNVKQDGTPEPYINITPISKDIGAGAATIEVAVTANVEFDVTPNVPWLTVSQATATTVTLQAQANTSTASRTGTVTFKQKNENFTATLTVNQAGEQTPTVTYVSFAGNDANDGKSWITAMKSISAAISITPEGSQVWVEEGVYTETVVMKNGVNVYGGFNRTESNIANRGTRQSRLSGRAFSMTDNFTMPTVIDGFEINGNSTAFYLYKNGIVNNCKLSNNTISMVGTASPALNISGGTVSHSTISDMFQVTSGGEVLNCYIPISNYTNAGVICLISLNGGRIEGCILSGNVHARTNDSREYNFVYYNGSDNFIVNCTFHNITKSGTYSSGFLRGSTSVGTSLSFVNNIVLPHSLQNKYVPGLYSGYNVEELGSIAAYFLDANYAPMSSNSPAVNKGSNSFVTLDKDILGNPRIQNGTVDIGAVESSF